MKLKMHILSFFGYATLSVLLTGFPVARAIADPQPITYRAIWGGSTQGCTGLPDLYAAEGCEDAKLPTLNPPMLGKGWGPQNDPFGTGIVSGYDYLEQACDVADQTQCVGVAVSPNCADSDNDFDGNLDTNYVGWCLVQAGQVPPPPIPTTPTSAEQNAGCPCASFSPMSSASSADSGQPSSDPISAQFVKDPINVGSGNLYETVTDFRGSGTFPLAFSRTYNSSIANQGTSPDGADNNMGVGWTTNVGGAHLYVNVQTTFQICVINGVNFYCPPSQGLSPVTVTVWHADGSQDVFNGTYPSPSGTPLTPAAIGTTGQLFFASLPTPNYFGYKYVRNDGYTEMYNEAGQLVAIQNPFGATQTYTYTYTTVNNVQVLSSMKVTDQQGRAMVISYSNGRITQMTDPAGNQYNYSYDTNSGDPGYGNLLTMSYTLQNGSGPYTGHTLVVKYIYGNPAYPHALTGVQDESETYSSSSAQYSSWTYDSQGRANSSQHAGGQDLTSIVYNSDGSADVTESTGVVRHITFTTINGRQMLATVSKHCLDCGDNTAAVSYDSHGHVSSISDFRGNITLYTMDPTTGLELSRTEGNGSSAQRTIATSWCGPTAINGNNCVLPFVAVNQITEQGRTTTYTYTTNVNNVVTQVQKKITPGSFSNPSRVTTQTYDGMGHLTSISGPRSVNVTNFAYYASSSAGNYNAGDLYTVTNALNQVTTFKKYDGNGYPTAVVDVNAVENDYSYDSRERLVYETDATNTSLSHSASYYYYPNGLLEIYESNDRVPEFPISYQYSYDDAHRLTSVYDYHTNYLAFVYSVDSIGYHTDEYIYSNCNYPTNCGNPLLHRQKIRAYNASQDQLTEIGGAGQTTVTGYDANGMIGSVKDGNGNATSRSYDALNRLELVVDPKSGNTSYNFDALDHLLNVTDPRGLNTQYTVDAFGNVTQVISPDTGTTSYTYDEAGDLIFVTDPQTNNVSYSYDSLNRLSFSYAGNSSIYTSQFVYDEGTYGIGHLTTVYSGIGSATSTDPMSFSYDARGNLISKTVNINGQSFGVNYAYNENRQLTQIGLIPVGSTSPTQQINFSHDSLERVISVSTSFLSGGTWNQQSLVSSATYEPFGPLASLTLSSGLTETRSYDTDFRLTGISTPGVQVWTLGHDANDNVTSLTDSVNVNNNNYMNQTWNYDQLNRVTANGPSPVAYTYDADGNRATKTGSSGNTTSYTYSTGSNQLVSATKLGVTTNYYFNVDGNMNNDSTYRYIYDPRSRVQQVTSVAIGAQVASYIYNAFGQRIQKTVGSTSTLFVYDESGHLLADLNGSGAINHLYIWMGDRPLSYYGGGGIGGGNGHYFIHVDQTNTPRYLTDSSGNPGWEWETLPYGENPPTPFLFGSDFNLGMPGQFYDAETGNFSNGRRDYDPAIGRYLQSDPIGLAGGINTYAYAGDNPTNRVDSTGLWSFTAQVFYGLGAGVQFGRDPGTGQFFLGVRYGVGIGAGLDFDPNGGRPHSSPVGCQNRGGIVASVFGEAGASLGPLNFGVSGDFGRDYSFGNGSTAYNGGIKPDFSLTSTSWGANVGVVAGTQLTLYGSSP